MLKLSELKPGQLAEIIAIEDAEHAVQLMEMGIIKGQKITLVHIAPLGDPIAVQVADYSLSIRKEDAAVVLVKLV